MIKFISILFFLLILTPVVTEAVDKSSGCGLGWRVTKSMTTSGSSTRSSTNGTFSNTLGMTSGTSGCDFHSIVLDDKNKVHFVEANLDPLKYEVALGFGERLDAAGQLFGCNQNSLGEFKTMMKRNSAQIFSSSSSASSVVDQMQMIIATDDYLRSTCLI